MRELTVLLTVGIAVLGLSNAASASNPTILWANIPFAFYADKELLPAGQYTFELKAIGFGSATASAVAVRNQDGSLATFILTMRGTDPNFNDQLHFNRYGNKYFLSKVEVLGLQANVRATKIERGQGADQEPGYGSRGYVGSDRSTDRCGGLESKPEVWMTEQRAQHLGAPRGCCAALQRKGRPPGRPFPFCDSHSKSAESC